MLKVKKTSIRLKQMKFYAYHGVLEQEKVVGGEYLVDLTLDIVAPTKALLEDDLTGTINYADVYSIVKTEMATPVDLLERLAYKIAEKLLHTFVQIETLKIEVRKVNPPMGADTKGASVVLEIER